MRLSAHRHLLRAFSALALPLLLSTARLHAQEASDATTHLALEPGKSVLVATVLATVLPGAGHVYAGEHEHGVRLYFGVGGLIGGGYLMTSWNRCSFAFSAACDPGDTTVQEGLGVVFMALGVGTWVWSVLDARDAARGRPDGASPWEATNPHARRLGPFLTPTASGVGAGIRATW